MRPLTEALAQIAEGWSPRHEITDRAVVMRAHAQAGNFQRAEEYAVEIETLHCAYDAYLGRKPAPMPEWAVSTWKIGHAAWADVLREGWLCGRAVWAADGWTAENVVGWLQYRYQDLPFTIADVVSPRVTARRVAA